MSASDPLGSEYQFPLWFELIAPVGITVAVAILLFGLLILGPRHGILGNLMLILLAPTCIISWIGFARLARRRRQAGRDTERD